MTRQEEIEDILETANTPNEAIDAIMESPKGKESIVPELIRVAWKTMRENAALELQLLEAANSAQELQGPIEAARESGKEIMSRAVGNLIEAIADEIIKVAGDTSGYTREMRAEGIEQIVKLVEAANRT